MNKKLAESLTQDFIASQKLADEIQAVLVRNNASYMSIAFAAIVIDRFLIAQVPEFHAMLSFADATIAQMQEEGTLPQPQPDGSVTFADGSNSRKGKKP